MSIIFFKFRHRINPREDESYLRFRHFRRNTGAEIPFAIVSGIVSRDAPGLVTVPEIFATDNSAQFPSDFLSGGRGRIAHV